MLDKLEDFTKEEIIQAIRNEYLINRYEEHLISACRKIKIEKLTQYSNYFLKKEVEASNEYNDFLLKHIKGKKLTDVPLEIIEKGAKIEKEMKHYHDLWKQNDDVLNEIYNKCYKESE